MVGEDVLVEVVVELLRARITHNTTILLIPGAVDLRRPLIYWHPLVQTQEQEGQVGAWVLLLGQRMLVHAVAQLQLVRSQQVGGHLWVQADRMPLPLQQQLLLHPTRTVVQAQEQEAVVVVVAPLLKAWVVLHKLRAPGSACIRAKQMLMLV